MVQVRAMAAATGPLVLPCRTILGGSASSHSLQRVKVAFGSSWPAPTPRLRSGSVGLKRLLPPAAKKTTTVRREGPVVEPESTPEELPADYFDPYPNLPGAEPDFWEGEQWDALGFVVEYLWAFGVVVALVGCLIAVRTYNSGATDFKDTAVFKEALESQFESESSSSVDFPAVTDAPALE